MHIQKESLFLVLLFVSILLFANILTAAQILLSSLTLLAILLLKELFPSTETHPPSLHPQASVLRPPLGGDPQTMSAKRMAEELDIKIAANKINAIKMILNGTKYTLSMKSDPNNFVMHMHRVYTSLRIYDMHTLLPLTPSQFDYAFNLSNPQKATLFDCVFMSLGDDVQATLPTAPGHNPDGQWLLRLLWTTNAPGVNVASLSQQNMRAYNDHRNTSGDPFAYILELNRLYASLGTDDKPTAPNFLQTVREQLASDPNARAVIRELSREGTPQPDKLLAALMEELKPIAASGKADSGPRPTLSAFASSRAPQQPRTNLPTDFINTLSERDKEGKCFFCHYGEHDWSKCRKWKDRLANPRPPQNRPRQEEQRSPDSQRRAEPDHDKRRHDRRDNAPYVRPRDERSPSLDDQDAINQSYSDDSSSDTVSPARKAYSTQKVIVQRTYSAFSTRVRAHTAPHSDRSGAVISPRMYTTYSDAAPALHGDQRAVSICPDSQTDVTCFHDTCLAIPGTLRPVQAVVQGIGPGKAHATHVGTLRFNVTTNVGTATITIMDALLIPDDGKKDLVLLEQGLLVRDGKHEIRHNEAGFSIFLQGEAGHIKCSSANRLPYFDAIVQVTTAQRPTRIPLQRIANRKGEG